MKLDRAIEICRDHIRIGKGMEPDINLYDVPHALEMVVNEVEKYRAEIEDGRLVRVPCKEGDTVFIPSTVGAYPVHVMHIGLTLTDYGTGYLRNFDEIGKSVFLTPEAALAAQEVHP